MRRSAAPLAQSESGRGRVWQFAANRLVLHRSARRDSANLLFRRADPLPPTRLSNRQRAAASARPPDC